MKKKLILFLVFFVTGASFCHAQQWLFGMTPSGGTYSGGNIFQVDYTGTQFKNDYSFVLQSNGPEGDVLQASNGLLYGMTSSGGTNNGGAIFSYDISSGTYTDLYDFGSGTDGIYPYGSLIQAGNGLLYGLTSSGGNYGAGIIFSFNITTGVETILYNFGNGTDGQNPNGSLMQATNGLLYGFTSYGGTNYSGIIFSYNITSGIETDLHDFGNGYDGGYPNGSLIQASNGLLYGMTSQGGINYEGIILSYNITTGVETDLHDFGNGYDGQGPYGSFIQATNGLLYGMTYYGGAYYGGTILSYDITTAVETDLYDFGATGVDGLNPYGSLVQATNGLLCGMTYYGGASYAGAIFNYDITTGLENNIHFFGAGTDGLYPMASIIQATNGLLYGMTPAGGTSNEGLLYSLNITTSAYADLNDFGSGSYGQYPYGALIKATNGLLYGMTSSAGNFGGGTMFSYNTATGALTTVHNFGSGTDGSYPNGSLMQASNGKLYGVTEAGGVNSYGIIFSYDISTGIYTDLYDFVGNYDAWDPQGELVQASNGLLYGMSEAGGAGGGGYNGTLFSYNITTGAEAVVFDFPSTTLGYSPDASLYAASNGLLYGTTDDDGGAYQQGTLFSFDVTSNTYTDMHDFGNGSDGEQPIADVVMTSAGVLYGLTSSGGNYGEGMIYSYDVNSQTYADVHDFGNGTDGQQPLISTPIQASNGSIYGMTYQGGANYAGMIFRYDISSSAYSDVHDFTGKDGEYPYSDLIDVDSLFAIGILPQSPLICLGTDVTLTASGGTTYTWQPSTGLNTTAGTSVIASPTVTTTYTVTSVIGSTTVTATDVVTVTSKLTLSVQPLSPSVCSGQTITLTASGGTTYRWLGTSDFTDSIKVHPTKDTTYELLASNGGCSVDSFISVAVNVPPALVIYPPSPTLCSGLSMELSVPASGSDYVWSPATALSATSGDTVTANPTYDITYSVTGIDSLGCRVSATDNINVQAGPNQPVITPSVTGDTLISSAKNGNEWYENDTIIPGATDSILIVTGKAPGTYKVVVTNVANGCSTTSNPFYTGINQVAANSGQLSIYPNPTNGIVNINISSSVAGVKDWSLQLIDVLGRISYARSSLNYANEIDLSNLPGGVYFISVTNKTGRMVFPVVKQ